MTQNVMGREPDAHRDLGAAALRRYDRIGGSWRRLGLGLQWAATILFFGWPYFVTNEPYLMDWPAWLRWLWLAAVIGGFAAGYVCISLEAAAKQSDYNRLAAAAEAHAQMLAGGARGGLEEAQPVGRGRQGQEKFADRPNGQAVDLVELAEQRRQGRAR